MNSVSNLKNAKFTNNNSVFSHINNKVPFIIIAALVLIIAASVAIINTSKAFSDDSSKYSEHVPGQVIAWLATESYSSPTEANDMQNDDNENLRTKANSKIDEFLAKYDCSTLACYAGDDQTYTNAKNDTGYITVKNPLLNTEANSNNAYPEIPVQERVVLIKFDESQKTMGSIITELEKNPLVKFAEPNYVCDKNSIGNLTDYQYAADKEGATETTHNKAGMSVEGWNTAYNIDDNDKVVAAVMDSGVDISHPDIPFAGTNGGYNLQAIGYGGQYGFNASAEDPTSAEAKDPDETLYSGEGHGTHVSGCIAAKWDADSEPTNKGVSGVASKCYILPIRLEDTIGKLSIAAYVRGTAYLIAEKTQNNVNIKVANNSWSDSTAASNVINECATKTGQANIITLFSSANDNLNIDTKLSTSSSFTNNPYVIVVNSTNEKGYKSAFSNYGVRTTDVCAPGTSILSTVPTKELKVAEEKTDNYRTSDTRVLTEGTDYTKIDDFENGQTTNLTYTSYKTGETLPIVGSDTDKKGYNSTHALGSLTKTNPQIYKITGNLSQYCKQGSSTNNISFLFNTNTGTQENENVVAVSILELVGTTPKFLYNYTQSTAWSGYMPISFPASALSDLANANILVTFDYYDENFQAKPAEAYLDNIAMAHVDMPYRYMSGTSMATPDCAGLTAIIANKFKNESTEKIVARVKAGTTHKEWLKDICYSGGIVNLSRSSSDESQLDPIVQSATMTTNNGLPVVELTGYFLGDNTSTVVINGQTATSVAYSQKSGKDMLTCTFANAITGEAKITVNKNGYSLTRYFDFGDSSNLLETLPQPSKDDAQFSDYYKAAAGIMISASENIICLNTPAQSDSNVYYKFDINNSKWSLSSIPTKIKETIGDNCKYESLNFKDNTIYFKITESGETKGLVRYDIDKDEVIDFVQFSDVSKYRDADNASTNANLSIKNATWLIIEDEIVYLGAYNNDTNDVYAYNYNDNTLTKINSGLNCGIHPTVFKQAENQYLFIDNGDYNPAKTGPTIFDVYYVTLSENGFSSEKSSVQAYPEQAKVYDQKTHTAYAYWNGQIITSGPAEFDTSSNNVNVHNAATYAYVKSDSFSIDANTGASTALPKTMSHYKISVPYTKSNNNIVYTSFIDTSGTIKVAKRVLDVTPTPVPPTPQPEKVITAATGDANSWLLTLAIFAGIVAGCYIVYSCRASKK